MTRELKDRSITLKAARMNAGLSAEEAADGLRVTQYRLYRWENGTSDVPLTVAWRMSELYEIPIQFLKPGGSGR